jgi:hypothetical protein
MMRFVALGDLVTVGLGDPMPHGGWRGWAELLAGALAPPGQVEMRNLARCGALVRDVAAEQVPQALRLVRAEVPPGHLRRDAVCLEDDEPVLVNMRRPALIMIHKVRLDLVGTQRSAVGREVGIQYTDAVHEVEPSARPSSVATSTRVRVSDSYPP